MAFYCRKKEIPEIWKTLAALKIFQFLVEKRQMLVYNVFVYTVNLSLKSLLRSRIRGEVFPIAAFLLFPQWDVSDYW